MRGTIIEVLSSFDLTTTTTCDDKCVSEYICLPLASNQQATSAID